MRQKSFFTIVVICMSFVVTRTFAQQKPPAGRGAGAPGGTKDPRVGLKAGLHDAGEAARGLEKVSSLGKPEGFSNVVRWHREVSARPSAKA